MRKLVAALAAGAVLAATPALAKLTPEESLSKLVAGRVAGEPRDCIPLNTIRSSQIVDGTAIVYDVGGTRYVNRPRSGANTLDTWDILVTRTHGTQLCNTDIVRLVDRTSRFPRGFVLLGDFVPYRKAPKAAE
jgi:hypothetical protein